MHKLANWVAGKCLNGGFPLVMMGIFWLGLWLFPWFKDYVENPHWGHNFSESMAFLSVGLAYYNRRFLSDLLALLASALIIPVALELLPVNVSAIISAILVALLIIDIIIERKREPNLLQIKDQRAAAWMSRYFLCFSYLMLSTLALTYYLIRVPAGTYETDIDTSLFDLLLLPFVVVLIVERVFEKRGRLWPGLLAFLVGMGIMIALLSIMTDEPETIPVLVFTVLVTCLVLVSLAVSLRLKPT